MVANVFTSRTQETEAVSSKPACLHREFYVSQGYLVRHSYTNKTKNNREDKLESKMESVWGCSGPVTEGRGILIYFLNFIIVYTGCFAYMNVCKCHVCLVPEEVRRVHRIPWNWSYKRLSHHVCVGGCTGSSGKAASEGSQLLSHLSALLKFLLICLVQ